MKYIRTKDRIISSLETVRTSDVVRKADTIEELIDRFVYDDDVFYPNLSNGCLETYDYEGLEVKVTEEKIQKGIYGAIWTDKGLIYVAKMNNKGELELL